MTTQTKTKSTALVPVEKGGTIGGDEANKDKRVITGRPTKLTPELTGRIAAVVRDGNYLITACQICGISKQSFLNWMSRGEEEAGNGRGLFFDFMCAIKKAEAEAEAERLARITEAGKGGQLSKVITYTRKDGTEVQEETFTIPQWLADMTTLERRHPERWGRKDRSTLVVEETKQIVITTVEVVKDYGNRKIEEKGEK